ncbi:ABC transporter permease [Pseudonocardia acaciae]|uniref:ABC transporter permease n=1 Tax=Pseudonocardia acaciae TaxID=551276 RepID=UPI00048A9D17|nr:ABC transporter permease [Pseudonocardia acaciae]
MDSSLNATPPARLAGMDRARALGLARDYGVYVALAALVLFNLAFTPHFATLENLRTQLVQVSPVLIIALGMALVIGTEGIDLSVGSVMALAAAVLPLYLGYGVGGGLVAALVIGAAAGLLNGGLVAFVGVQPIVATLALLVGGRGLALVIAQGRSTPITEPGLLELGGGSTLSVPNVVLAAFALVVVVALLVGRTTFGRRLVAIGGNRTAAEFAGLPVTRVLLVVYLLSGLLAAFAGVLATGQLTASDPSNIGLLIELSAITAVVVGGTPLTGGRIRVVGTVAGAILMQLIIATLIRNNVPSSVAQMSQAAIIVAAVAVQRAQAVTR